jgi:ribulose-5-phosphate 4-epimerase/fuculose-1-phosphate aldolase
MSSVADERARRQHQLVDGYRIFASYGWGDDGSGHISARDPEDPHSFWLLRYGVAFADASIGDLVRVLDSGEPVDGPPGAAINPAAHFIHTPIHRTRPDVVAVAHTHTGYGTPFAALARTLRMTSQEACAFSDRQGVFLGEELDVTDLEAGHRLADAGRSARVLVLANHGLLTVGASVAETIGWFVLAERAAEVEIKAGADARVISPGGAANVHVSMGDPTNAESVFAWLRKSRLRDR